MKKPKILEKLRTDDRAVSPVLGVALLIAVTVILAAVIAYVVFGVGTGSAANAQASFSFDVDDTGAPTVTHDGGDGLEVGSLNVTVNGGTSYALDDPNGDGLVTSGESTTLGTTVSDGDVIRVVWNDPESDQSSVLAKFEV